MEERSCENCRHGLSGGYDNCRLNLEDECGKGEREAWEPMEKSANVRAFAGKRDRPPERRLSVIRNRDIPLLRAVPAAMQAVCLAERQIQWQRERLFRITQNYSSGGGGGGVPSGYEKAFGEISEAVERHQALCVQYTEQLKAAEKVLNSIPILSMRVLCEMRYVYGVGGQGIMRELSLTDYAYKRARAAIERASSMAAVEWGSL